MPEPIPAPVPVSGTFSPALGRMLLTFDKDLVTGPINEQQWSVVADSLEWETQTILVPGPAPRLVLGQFLEVDPRPPGDTVTYTAAIPDLVGQNGRDVVAFTDFPLTLI